MKIASFLIRFLSLLTLSLTVHFTWAQNAAPNSNLSISRSADVNTKSDPVAIVNGQKITQLQLDAASAQSLKGVADNDTKLRIKNQILNNLINQTLVKQAISSNQFTLNAEDKQQIDNMYDQAVLNFYLAKQVGDLPQPSKQAIDDYIQRNHNVFEKRKTYHFTQILIDSENGKDLETIKSLIQKGATLNDLTTWLTQVKIPYSRNNTWRGSEQISPATLSILENLKPNVIDLSVTPDKKLIQALELQGAYPDPVNIEDARSGIIRGISQDASNKAAKTALENLRTKADIQILDEALSHSLSTGPLEARTSNAATVTMSQQAAIVWLFALLILVPASIATLYFQITPSTESDFRPQEDTMFSAARLPPWFNLYTFRIPILAILAIILLYPLIGFVFTPPAWLTMSRLMRIGIAGLVFGVGVVALLSKIQPLLWVWRKKWIPTLILFFINLLVILGR